MNTSTTPVPDNKHNTYTKYPKSSTACLNSQNSHTRLTHKSNSLPYYANSYEYQRRDALSFLWWAFEDALIRHPEGRLVTAECEGVEGNLVFKQQTAHRCVFMVNKNDNYFGPTLMSTGTKVKGKGLRVNESATCTPLLVFDFDSLSEFNQAEERREEMGLSDWDFVTFTGGRGVQAGYLIDAYPLTDEGKREYYRNVLQGLSKALSSDSKATLLTQLLRLPGTPHAFTGRLSTCYVRVGSKTDAYGKLERIADILREHGFLKPKKGKRADSVKYWKVRKSVMAFLESRGGTVDTGYKDLCKLFGVPVSSMKYLVSQLERRGLITRTLLRDGQRNKGIRVTLVKKKESKTEAPTAKEIKNISDSLNVQRKNKYIGLGRSRPIFLNALAAVRKAWLQGLPLPKCRNTAVFTSALGDYAAGVCPQRSKAELWAGNLRRKDPLSLEEFERTHASAYSGRYSGPVWHYLNEIKEKVGLDFCATHTVQRGF